MLPRSLCRHLCTLIPLHGESGDWPHLCTSPLHLHRPTFEAVLESLMILRAAEPGDTPAVYVPVPRHSRHSSKQEILGGSGVAQEALAKLQDPNNPSVSEAG
jgi:hypothetical protein